MDSAGREHERRSEVSLNAKKYPRTPYWPYSPGIGRDDGMLTEPQRFVSVPVVATEKLDGSNTLIHAGKVYGRSVSAPSEAKWMAMVKKHHAWKATEPDVCTAKTSTACTASPTGRCRRTGPITPSRFEMQMARSPRSVSWRPMPSGGGYRSSRSCSGGSSVQFRRYTHLLNAPTASAQCSAASGKASCCGLRAGSLPPSSRISFARAFGQTMCNLTSIGPGTGNRAELLEFRSEDCRRRLELSRLAEAGRATIVRDLSQARENTVTRMVDSR